MGTEIKKALIISGAPCADTNLLKSFCQKNDYFIICADYGYNYVKNTGIVPDLLVGDFDSTEVPGVDIETIKLPCEKDVTDTFFAVETAIKRGYNDIIMFAAIGNRIDHSYANILCLDYINKNNCKGRIITAACSIELLNAGEYKIVKEKFKYLSVFPFLTDIKGLTIKNVKYPLVNVDLDVSCQLGVSNEIINDECIISLKEGKILLIKSND